MIQNENTTQSQLPPKDELSSFIRRAGGILAVSYPTLALATGFRAGYQLCCKPDVVDYLPPTLSLVAAICYLLATFGFKYRNKGAWWLSVGVLGFETIMTFIIGTISIISPELVGRTVWRWFGVDYGFFPLFQPILGIAWLFHPEILHAYGINWKFGRRAQ